MFDELNRKAVLITGASTGIGAAVATGFGRFGARVAVHYNQSREPAEQVAAKIRAAGGEAVVLQGDVTEAAEVTRIVEETVDAFGRIDVLINNAGDLIRRTPLAEITDEHLDDVLALNATSVVVACRAAFRHFERQGGGNVINTTSIAARNGGGPGSTIYGSAKAFVLNFTRGLAKELAPANVRVNSVAPGVIMTPFHERNSTPEQLDAMRGQIPLGRLGRAEDCVGAYLFLATDALSGYITGQTIDVNGGQYVT